MVAQNEGTVSSPPDHSHNHNQTSDAVKRPWPVRNHAHSHAPPVFARPPRCPPSPSPSAPATPVTPPRHGVERQRPRHFASYHPVEPDSPPGANNRDSLEPFRRHNVPFSAPTSPRRPNPSHSFPRRPLPTLLDFDGMEKQPRSQSPAPAPVPVPVPTPAPARGLLSPERGRAAGTASTTAPPGVYPALKPALSLTNIRAQKYSAFRNDRWPASATPFSAGNAAAARFMHSYNQPDVHVGDTARSSFQSSMTGSSSVDPVSATERSSVVTKSSSMTDLLDTPIDDGEVSVDDVMDLYLNGFDDDPRPIKSPIEEEPDEEESYHDLSRHPSAQSTGSPDSYNPPDSEKSSYIISNDHPPQSPTTPITPPAVEPSPTTPTFPFPPPPKDKFALPDLLSMGIPPPLSPVTAQRDQYGFKKKSQHITVEQYDTWYKSYAPIVTYRRKRWIDVLASNGLNTTDPASFPPKCSKIRRYVRKGIPPELRGAAWFWYAGGYTHLNSNPGLYRRLIETALKRPMNDDKEHIERDLHRTFPDNIHFKPDASRAQPGTENGSSNPKYAGAAPETPIVQSLRRVLYAFAVHNPRIGYTQSLNFIAGMFLLFLPEEKAFWMLHIITSEFLPGTHEVSLEGANADLWILMVVLKESLPAIYTKVASQNPTNSRSKPPIITATTRLPDITLGLTNWLMSMFISSLPLETTLRVWDILFYEGSRTFFRVALAIFRLNQKSILALSDPMEIFQLVQTAPKHMIDPNILITESFAKRFKLSEARLESLRESRREVVRAGKERLSYLVGPGKMLAADDIIRPSSPLPEAWRNLKSHLHHAR